MEYKQNLAEAVRRNRELWTGRDSRVVLAKIEIEGYSAFDLWMEVLSPDICPDYKKMFNMFISNFRFRAGLRDDALPTARPSFGSSVYGAFFGAEIQIGRTGPYAKPILSRVGDFGLLTIDFQRGWLAKQIEASRYFTERAAGKCGVSIVETMDNLNLAENLCGSNIYVELIDNPRDLLLFFDKALEFNVALVTRQRDHLQKFQGGYFDIHEIWVPYDTVWLSIDAWNLVDSGTFKRMGLPHIQRFIDHFGSAWLHMHNQGLHLLDDVLTLRGLVGIGILDDATEPRCFPRLKEIQITTKNMPLQINCSKNELLDGIKARTLPRNVMYWVDRGVASVEEANRIMLMVKNY